MLDFHPVDRGKEKPQRPGRQPSRAEAVLADNDAVTRGGLQVILP